MASKSSVGKRTDDNSAVAIRKVALPDANAGLLPSVEKKSPLCTVSRISYLLRD